MYQGEYRIFDDKNNEFIVTYKEGSFECKKVDGSTLVEPTREELEFVIKELEKKLNETATKSFDELYNEILKLIEEKKINNYDELHNHINSLNISEQQKYELFEKTQSKIMMEERDKSDIIKLKDEIIDTIRKNQNIEIAKIISFDVRANIAGTPLCHINFSTIDNGLTKIQKETTLDYNEELKKELIEPVLQELVLTSKSAQKVEPSDASFGYRSNLHLQTEANCFAHLNNIEQDYAYKLQEDILSLNNSPKLSSPVDRDSKMNALHNENEIENQREKDQQLKRVKKMKMTDNKGFSNNLIIYLLISIVTTFIILTQIILIK